MTAGRNFTGKICIHHRGGGKRIRKNAIDFFRRINCYGFLIKIIKPIFTSSLGLIIYENGFSNYILLTKDLMIGDIIFSGTSINKKKIKNRRINYPQNGYSIPLFNVTVLSIISTIEIYPFSGFSINRSAGTKATLISRLSNNKNLLKVKSG